MDFHLREVVRVIRRARFLVSALVPIVLLALSETAFAQTAGTYRDLPPVTSAAEDDYPPFSMVDPDGQADGFSVELMRAALAAMGREVTFRTGPWPQVRGLLERGEIQALPLVGRNPEREALFDFTVPYMSLYGAIVVRSGTVDIQDLSDLRGRSVVVMEGDNAEEFLRRRPRGIAITTVPSYEEALRELAAGQHDAVVMQRLVALRLVDQLGLDNLTVRNRPIEEFRQDFCFAVAEGDRETLALLNEGLALVTADGTKRRLHAKWFASLQLPSQRRIMVAGDRDFPPWEFLDSSGRPAGYNVDLIRAVARATGLDIDIRLGPWSQVRSDLEHGQVDVLQGMFYSPERDREVDFSPAHAAVHYVAVVRAGEASPPDSWGELRATSVVVQHGDIAHDRAQREGLAGQVTAVVSQSVALDRLVSGEFDVAVVSRASALFWLERHPDASLAVGAEPLLSADYCFAVPEGHGALLATLTEGLQTIEETGEYREIRERWMGVYQPGRATLREALRGSALVLGVLLVGLAVVFGWSWTLRRQVARKTAELRESEARFRRAVTEAPVPIMMHADDGEILAISRAWCELTGYLEDELRTVSDWVRRAYRGDADAVKASIDRLYEVEGRVEEGEFEIRCRDDSIRFWEFSSTGLGRMPDGRGLAISIASDVTDRRLAERRLRDQASLLRTAGEVARLGGWSVPLPPERVIWSDVVAAIHEMPAGYSPSVDEGIGFYAPEYRERIRQVFTACVEDGVPYDEELQILTATGRRVWVRAIGAPERDQSGRIARIVGAFQDISERRDLEEQLLQAQKMESIGRLAGGVAHDYNNVLMVILNKAELVQRRMDADDPLQADVAEIIDATRRSAEITRQLLGFARKQTIEPRRLDLNDEVERLLSMLHRLLGEDIDLEWKPDSGLGEVLLDPVQVDQVLTNLCVNARDAIAGVGKLTIETAMVAIDEAYCRANPGFFEGAFVLLAVSDDGCGMDAETLRLAFEPFFTTKGVGRGTGLGLATVYGIVKQNGGFVHAYSEPGSGSTFKIYLPVAGGSSPGRKPQTESPSEGPPSGRGERILVVEDDGAILSVLAEILEDLGYEVLTAHHPDEALELMDAHGDGLDLLITDVVMPGMDGAALAERLRATHPDLRVLFMSGYTANVIAHHGVLDEGVHFLQKPFTTASLATTVRRVLRDGPDQDPAM